MNDKLLLLMMQCTHGNVKRIIRLERRDFICRLGNLIDLVMKIDCRRCGFIFGFWERKSLETSNSAPKQY